MHRSDIITFFISEPKRSGDIYVVFEPNFYINVFDGFSVASIHGSQWNCDTYVPVIFSGLGLKS